jgi:hypothetical protein
MIVERGKQKQQEVWDCGEGSERKPSQTCEWDALRTLGPKTPEVHTPERTRRETTGKEPTDPHMFPHRQDGSERFHDRITEEFTTAWENSQMDRREWSQTEAPEHVHKKAINQEQREAVEASPTVATPDATWWEGGQERRGATDSPLETAFDGESRQQWEEQMRQWEEQRQQLEQRWKYLEEQRQQLEQRWKYLEEQRQQLDQGWQQRRERAPKKAESLTTVLRDPIWLDLYRKDQIWEEQRQQWEKQRWQLGKQRQQWKKMLFRSLDNFLSQ